MAPERSQLIRTVRRLGRWPVLGALLGVLVLSCGGDDGAGPDADPPAAVTDLAILFVTHDSTGLTWTSPGDDGSAGRAAGYELRYDSIQLTAGSWDTRGIALAELELAERAPREAGSAESLTVTGLPVGRSLRARDEVPNWSALSTRSTSTSRSATRSLRATSPRSARSAPDPTSLTSWLAPGATATPAGPTTTR
ncbi:MAG: hypothetical protein R3E97_00990 [Candidatus Eisenbacteria bacterium]